MPGIEKGGYGKSNRNCVGELVLLATGKGPGHEKGRADKADR